MAAYPYGIFNNLSGKPQAPDMQITVRIKECHGNEKSSISTVSRNSKMLQLHHESFTFDHIKWENESQERVYKAVAFPYVDKALHGHSATILAFGPSGTGKSYTMGSLLPMMNNWQKVGLIQRCLKHIFEEKDIQVSVSYVGIVGEQIHDLLNMAVTLHRSVEFDPKIEIIKSLEDGLQMVNKAHQIRQESQSSGFPSRSVFSLQSHTLLTFHLKIKDGDKFLESAINLVDLDGTEVDGEKPLLDESLSALKKVINRISRNPEQTICSKDSSILDSILEDILDSKYLVSLVACINSDPENDHKATLKTLRVAESVKTLRNRQSERQAPGLSTDLNPEIAGHSESPLPCSIKIEVLNDDEDQKLEKIQHPITGKTKDCMVILNKFDIDSYYNECSEHFKENIAPKNLNGADIPTQKIISSNIEIGCSAGTESTLSIGRMQAQNTAHEIFTQADDSSTRYSRQYLKCLEESLFMSSLENMATVDPTEIHNIDSSINKDLISDTECQCPSLNFDCLTTMGEVSQSPGHQGEKEEQFMLADNVSQLSISEREMLSAQYSEEKQGYSKSNNIRNIYQVHENREIITSTPRINKTKRFRAILTDFSEPGPSSQTGYEIPRKIIKLDETVPTLRLKRVPDLQSEPEEATCAANSDNSDDIENGRKEISDKQKAHNNNLLRILNTSTAAELLDLPRIGFKTAVSIYQYRLIHGDFESLKSFEKMSFWTGKVCQNFFAANNIFFE